MGLIPAKRARFGTIHAQRLSYRKDGSAPMARDQLRRRFGMGAVGWIVVAVIVVAGVWTIMTYNGLVSLRQRGRQAFSDIDVQLKQRHDLVPNLVETVKGYAAHERQTLENVIKARNAAVSAEGPTAQALAEGQLQGALRQLFALAEAYPDLKATQNFQQLQNELSDLENKIAASRRFFNNTAAECNATRESFPAVLFAPSRELLGAGVLQSRRRRARGRVCRAAGEVLARTRGAPPAREGPTVTS
jgi:LemA protein